MIRKPSPGSLLPPWEPPWRQVAISRVPPDRPFLRRKPRWTRPFAPTIANAARPSGPPPEGMVWIPAANSSMGATAASEGMCDCTA